MGGETRNKTERDLITDGRGLWAGSTLLLHMVKAQPGWVPAVRICGYSSFR